MAPLPVIKTPALGKLSMMKERARQFEPLNCRPLGKTLSDWPKLPFNRICGPFGFELAGSVLPSRVVALTRLGNPSVGRMLKTLLLKPASLVGMSKVMVVRG